MHEIFRIGHFWSHIPGYETRGQCNKCYVTEDMNHILTICKASPVSQIWAIAQETWPNINIGIILAGGSITTPEEEDPTQNENESDNEENQEWAKRRSEKKGKDRLLQILISESAHLIWVLRCEQVINTCSHTTTEIQTRWLKAINARLTDNKIIATKIHCGKTSAKLVKSTWVKALQKHSWYPGTGYTSERF